ncbi:MAG: SigE family RNA polymerase sigma factor [Acidimicrobiia bacterium]
MDTERPDAGAWTVASSELTEFCRREYPRLVGMLSLYCGDADLAEDLAQEAIARACQHWPKVQKMPAPGAWIHRVAVNLANSWFRRWAFRRRVLEKLGRSYTSVHIDQDTSDVVTMRQAVATLPVRQRTALVLRYYADFSVEQVAESMSCSEGTVKALTSQAIAALRSAGMQQVSEVLDGS